MGAQTPRTPTMTISISIVGAPVACSEGVKDAWRDIAAWVAGQLHGRFGEAISVCYFDLFDQYCPPLPPGAQLPYVLVNGEEFSSGGKISVAGLRARVEALVLDAIETQESGQIVVMQ
ncbi:MAG: hypothetical protein ABI670_15670 [Chloroflexota bacterium]